MYIQTYHTKGAAARRVGWKRLFHATRVEEPYRFENDTLGNLRIQLIDVPVTQPYGGSTYWVERHNQALTSEPDNIVYVVYSWDGEYLARLGEHETAEAALGSVVFLAAV